jgi:septum formation protein
MRSHSGSLSKSNFIPNRYFFILASASPRRKELLTILGFPFVVVVPESPSPKPDSKVDPGASNLGIDETPLPGEAPPELVQRLSRAKALAVTELLPAVELPKGSVWGNSPLDLTAIIIAADTVVVSGDKILGKPLHPAEAIQMLIDLRQQQYHYVYSGLTVAIVSQTDYGKYNPRLITRLHQSKVWMRPYTNAEIEAYVASGDPMDKAGAYAIQNKDFAPVERLEGCFASVMGLPLGELLAALTEIGLSFPAASQQCRRYSGFSCCLEIVGY